MKKSIIVLVLVLMMVVALAGCSKLGNDNFPPTIRGSLVERWNAANLALAESSIDNAAALQREAELIAYTADKGKAFSVVFLCQDKVTDTVFLLPEITYRLDHANAYEYRELCKVGLLEQAMESSDELCISGTILGVIVHWESTNSWGHKSYYSMCDFDFDGAWDYATKDPSEFDRMHFNVGNEPNDSSDPSRTIGDYNTVVELSTCESIRYRSEIVPLSELSGDEVFKDFEKLIKKKTAA